MIAAVLGEIKEIQETGQVKNIFDGRIRRIKRLECFTGYRKDKVRESKKDLAVK